MSDKIMAVSLITVKTIKKKHLEQMRRCLVGTTIFSNIAEDLLHDKPSRVVGGWVTGKFCGINDAAKVYLVHGPGPDDWCLVESPQEGTAGTMGLLLTKYKDVPQLFVD